ncbi:RluA family pseudouridine synthase [Desulforhopalus vacuolatus]|uniref:RluA family pseudouridine synthase n=1 Tax=Desulforhopalus vacuolatus TaxID=40414 RepID=UPI0019622F89|nr:RluA family pseudouridine synthase [Desulforhopalus vacuolatus]MBM9520687.1 RluA family pseudouridine synthase [Desulforhopalus vacuolatus]
MNDYSASRVTVSTPGPGSGSLCVNSPVAGMRLDQFLVLKFPEHSRSVLSTAIREGWVLVDLLTKKTSYRLKTGEQVVFDFPALTSSPGKLLAEPIDFPVLFEDEYLLFLSKPPGLVVHPGSGNPKGTLVNGLLHYCEQISTAGNPDRPGIVHRLDKDTSGVMVVAKTPETHRELSTLFKNHQLQKIYLAIVCGIPSQEKGRVVAPIGRHPVRRQKMALVSQGGRYAASNWELEETFSGFSLLRVEIETGRTHQIRVHLEGEGFPVAGDQVYGGSRRQRRAELFPRQMLHASTLILTHPVTGETLHITAPLWPDFQKTLTQLRSEMK